MKFDNKHFVSGENLQHYNEQIQDRLNDKVDIKDYPSIKQGEGENSIIANDIAINQAIGDNSIAFGTNTLAGAKGYYY